LEKWPEAKELLGEFEGALVRERFHLLPITVPHAAGLIQAPHRDPFDRLIAAQATLEGLTLVSSDSRIATLGAPVLW
jgi:PIN domain nuclease of toxin-antitoxin system